MRKKKTGNFDEKNFREKNLRWKIKEKNWRAENFLKKKIRKQGTFNRKKLYEQIKKIEEKNFYIQNKKISSKKNC